MVWRSRGGGPGDPSTDWRHWDMLRDRSIGLMLLPPLNAEWDGTLGGHLRDSWRSTSPRGPSPGKIKSYPNQPFPENQHKTQP